MLIVLASTKTAARPTASSKSGLASICGASTLRAHTATRCKLYHDIPNYTIQLTKSSIQNGALAKEVSRQIRCVVRDLLPASIADLYSNSGANVAFHGCWFDCCVRHQCRCECDDGLYDTSFHTLHWMSTPQLPRSPDERYFWLTSYPNPADEYKNDPRNPQAKIDTEKPVK